MRGHAVQMKREEYVGHGLNFMDIWNRMYRERILYIGQDLDDEFANQMIAVLLWLNNEDATQGVQLYFNCPGGEVNLVLPGVLSSAIDATGRSVLDLQSTTP
eukprot:768433-Hanusia_phi.AAC.3